MEVYFVVRSPSCAAEAPVHGRSAGSLAWKGTIEATLEEGLGVGEIETVPAHSNEAGWFAVQHSPFSHYGSCTTDR